MKKLNLLRAISLLLFSVIVLFGCRNENLFENTNNVKKKNFKISEIKNNEILKDKIIAKEIFKVQKEKFGKSINARSTQDSILDGAKILTENVLLIDNGTQKTYTFPIKRSYVSSKLENLVLKKNADSTFSGTLIQYDLTNEEKALMLSGHFVDLKNKFKIFDINKLSIQSRVATEAYGCYVITWETGVCASGQHAYRESGCTLTGNERAGAPSVISVVNTCGGGGIGSNGGTSDPNFPNNTDTSGGGSTGSDTTPYNGDLMNLPPMLKNDSDCNNAKAIYENTAVKSRYDLLKAHTRDSQETGYGFKTIIVNGVKTTQTDPLNPDSGNVDRMHTIIQSTSFGYNHTHIEKPEGKLVAKIFSPADIDTFVTYLHNAKTNNIPFGNIFGGMLAEEYGSNGSDYFIYQMQYNGDGTDLPPELTEAQREVYRDEYFIKAQKMVTEDNDISHYNLQKLFFHFVKKMNLKNCVLFKIKNGIRRKITLDEDGNPKEEICS